MIFSFRKFSVKEISFEIDLFVTFDHVQLMRFLIDCGKYLISVFFRLCASSRKFHLVEGYPLDFITDFGMRKVVCGVKLVSPSKDFTEQKKWLPEIPVGGKVVSESQAYFLGCFLALRKWYTLQTRSFASLRNLSGPNLLYYCT